MGLLAVEDDKNAGGHHRHAHEDDQAAAEDFCHDTLQSRHKIDGDTLGAAIE
jgi:hypothetical protein